MTTGVTLNDGSPTGMTWHMFWWQCEAEARDNPAAMSDLMKVAGERVLEALFDGMAPSGAAELVYTTMVACQHLVTEWAGEPPSELQWPCHPRSVHGDRMVRTC
jgi:hypothetical protein